MILVIGATGMLGMEICRQLTEMGSDVRALVRTSSDQTKRDELEAMGVELKFGDLREGPSLEDACQRISTIVATASSMPFSYLPQENDIQTVDLEGMRKLVEAARSAGVGHFIYTSLSPHMDMDYPLRNAKRAIEKRLKDSGLTYTILRPSYFMEVWLTPAVGFDVANAKAQVFGTGENPVSLISFRDVARFAVEAVDNPAARNATLELGGPDAVAPMDVVHIFEEAGAGHVDVQHVPDDALREQHRSAVDPMEKSFAGLMRCFAQGDAIEMKRTLERFPVRLMSVEEYAKNMFSPS